MYLVQRVGTKSAAQPLADDGLHGLQKAPESASLGAVQGNRGDQLGAHPHELSRARPSSAAPWRAWPIVGGVEELADASALRDDPAALRRRLAEDGYLFFRGLLPAAEVGAAADCVLAALRQGGWVTGSGIASAGRRALDFRE